MGPAYMPLTVQDDTDAEWGWRANLPSACDDCRAGWHNLYPYLSATYPDDRMSLVSSLRDPSIQGRFAPYSPLDTLLDFQSGILDLTETVLAPLGNMEVFLVPAVGHVWTIRPNLDSTVVDSVSLETFLRRQISNDPTWTSRLPSL